MSPSEKPSSGGDAGTSRRAVLKGATAAVGAFIAFEAIGSVTLAAGASPKSTPLANGVIFTDATLCIGCLTCEVICSQVHKQAVSPTCLGFAFTTIPTPGSIPRY
jgi:ferredoxin